MIELRNYWILIRAEAFKLEKDSPGRSVARMDNRTSTRDAERDNAMAEAVHDQLLGRLMDMEKLMSIIRLIQTVIVLLEWLLPLIEDVRLNANQRDIIVMLRDNLMNLESELQYQSWELREHILDRYHRALRGWREQ